MNLFHCESGEIQVHLAIVITLYAVDLSVEVLDLCGRISSSALLYSSPQNIVTDFWRGLIADVLEWLETLSHPLLDIIC